MIKLVKIDTWTARAARLSVLGAVVCALGPVNALADAVPNPVTTAAFTRVAGLTPAPGYFFVTPYQLKDSPASGPQIVDNEGRIVYFDQLPKGTGASNFQVQTYEGHKVLTFWEGTTGNPAYGSISGLGIGQGEDVIMNTHYQIIKVIKLSGGLEPDAHEFTLTPNGDALVTAYSVANNQEVKAGYPGVFTAGVGALNVDDSHALTIDVKTDKILSDWDSLSHVPVQSSNQVTMNPWDYFHINSISLDPQGNYLVSGRNTWAIYDVNPQSGDINWQLGGHGSSFTLGQGVSFSWQHDSRFVSPDEIELFDDGAGQPYAGNEQYSRAEWIHLDFSTMTATLVRQIQQPADQKESWSQGSVQTLADGDVVVGWGSAATFTEYSPSGQLVLTGTLPGGPTISVSGLPIENAWNSYRTFKDQWSGSPLTPPVIAVQSTGSHHWTISAAWNGATALTTWRVLAGSSKSKLKRVATVAWAGLNTDIPISGSKFRYVRVQALNAKGRVISRGNSKVTSLL